MKPFRRDRLIDLYAIRCAVAALVHARHHIHELCTADVLRVDTAVAHLDAISPQLAGDLADATKALLSDAPDPGGQRTVRAIDRLGNLTHVDDSAADALAASLRPPTPVQPSLFEPQPVEETT